MSKSTVETSLNGDLSKRVSVATADLEWTPSPSGSVWRKRVHLVGPAESGQVTSIVRYQPDSVFPPHDHPEGEEILVLEGVFSDEHGDWGSGTYLLNPEGVRHTPFSKEGCVILVKLRQYPGLDRDLLQLPTDDIAWTAGSTAGRFLKMLYQQPGFHDQMRLERWDPGTSCKPLGWPEGAEIFVISGQLADEEGNYPAGSWLRLPPGSKHNAASEEGCELYIKEGGFHYLRSGQASA